MISVLDLAYSGVLKTPSLAGITWISSLATYSVLAFFSYFNWSYNSYANFSLSFKSSYEDSTFSTNLDYVNSFNKLWLTTDLTLKL
jgi:hypothetical protein